MYDSTLGQFVSEDPIGILGGDPNFRRYVGKGAATNTDPLGLYVQQKTPKPPEQWTWDDFKEDKNLSEGDAKTNWGYPFGGGSFETVGRGRRFRSTFRSDDLVRIEPRPGRRVPGETRLPLLEHEKTHGKIAVEVDRQLSNSIGTTPVTGEGSSDAEALKEAKRKLEALKTEIRNFHDTIQRQYDDETKHGTLEGPQKEWNENLTKKITPKVEFILKNLRDGGTLNPRP